MSKIFIIGDSHIGLGYPNNTEKWFKIHKEYFSEFLIPLLKSKFKKGDIIVHLGDLFDNRNVIPINIMNYGMDIVEEISKIGPFHIIIGNHDLYSKSTSEINSIRPFRYIPNVFIYDKPSVLIYNNIKILMMPFIEKRLEQIGIIQDNKDCDYVFCHSDLNGCRMHLTSVANRNADKIDIEEFKNFRKVRSGHIHITQEFGNYKFVGSIFQMDRNDYGDQKGILIIDTKDESEVFYPNNISPVFKKYKVLSEDDIDGLDIIKGSKDYIDLSISNNLLVSNRKLRRKLESMLENGNFSSVDYIDDITKELVENEETDLEVVDENGISIQLDYEDYILDYIKSQKYNSDKFKEGVSREFNEIISIYKESYKKLEN